MIETVETLNMSTMSNPQLAEAFILADGQERQNDLVRYISNLDFTDVCHIREEISRTRPDLRIKLAHGLIKLEKEWYDHVMRQKYSLKQKQ